MFMPEDIFLIIGAGSHAHRVAEAICASGGTIVGFAKTDVPTSESYGEAGWNQPLRFDQALERFPEAAVVVGIGAIEPRSKIIESIRRLGRRLPPIVHPQSTVSPSAELGDGVVILPAAVVEWRATIGVGAIIDTHAIVSHEARIGAMSHIQTGTIVGPRAEVRPGTKTQIGERILEEHS